MHKGFTVRQQEQSFEDNMSNLTSASGEGASETAGTSMYPPPQASLKRKRNLPGNPDPEAEVISLSPKTLMEKNRFVCEICSKGFARDQNLQLHRRGHNLPWKLKQRNSKEIKKKVYVCPETSCVHHDPSRALGDLTGIKKHFSRKHGEKKWKCEKCSKKYAVQSDWKAHSKICGTREYRCDCGTLFSRRDSFITHRAFCDALAEESSRAITESYNNNNPLLTTQFDALPPPPPQSPVTTSALSHMSNNQLSFSQTHFNGGQFNPIMMKKEQQNFSNSVKQDIPPWLSSDHHHQDFSQLHNSNNGGGSSSSNMGPTLPPYHTITPHSPHMSATALLQKAAQMGATMSQNHNRSSTSSSVPFADFDGNNTASIGLNLSSHENMATSTNAGVGPTTLSPQTFFNDMMMNSGFDASFFEDAFGGRLSLKKDEKNTSHNNHGNYLRFNQENGNVNEGLTRDFLGLKPLSQNDFFTIDGLENCINNTSNDSNENQNQKSWQGN